VKREAHSTAFHARGRDEGRLPKIERRRGESKAVDGLKVPPRRRPPMKSEPTHQPVSELAMIMPERKTKLKMRLAEGTR